MKKLIALLILIVAGVLAIWSSIFVVNQDQFGWANKTLLTPGLHFKWPGPLENVRIIEIRPQEQVVLNQTLLTTEDAKTLSVTAILRYRINNIYKFTQHFNEQSNTLHEQMIKLSGDAFTTAFANHSLQDILVHQSNVIHQIFEKIKPRFSDLGLDILDIQLTRLDLTGELISQAMQQMQMQQQYFIAQLKEQNQEAVHQVYSQARLAQQQALEAGYKQAQNIKGAADAKAAQIIEPAYRKDPKFYRFYQNMQLYKNSLNTNDTVVVEPNDSFLSYAQ